MVTIADNTGSIFAAAIRSVPIALAVIDRDLRYVEVNEACATMTGRPLGDHPGRTLREINPLLTTQMEGLFRHVLSTGESILDLRLSRPTPHAPGGSMELVMNITPFRGADGEILGLASTATDVSEWVRMQDRMAHVAKLESSVRLASEMTHDFNNALTVISARCDLALLDLPADAAAREDIETIREATLRASQSTRQLSAAAAEGAIIPAPTNICQMIRDAESLLGVEVAAPNKLVVIPCHEAASVLGDRTELEQLLLELVRNGAAALDHPGDVTVRAYPVELAEPRYTLCGTLPAGPHVVIAVSDTGRGMDDAIRSRMFEPRFSTHPGPGRGLGLARLFGIVQAMHGGIEVESELHRGTQVRLYFPQVHGTSTRTSTSRHRTGRVLLVCADDSLRELVSGALSRNGFEVHEARQEGHALRLAGEGLRFDLVVTDREMPLKDGAWLADRLAEHGVEAPVLLMGEPRVAQLESPAPPKGGKRRSIAKPFTMQALLTASREALVG